MGEAFRKHHHILPQIQEASQPFQELHALCQKQGAGCMAMLRMHSYQARVHLMQLNLTVTFSWIGYPSPIYLKGCLHSK